MSELPQIRKKPQQHAELIYHLNEAAYKLNCKILVAERDGPTDPAAHSLLLCAERLIKDATAILWGLQREGSDYE